MCTCKSVSTFYLSLARVLWVDVGVFVLSMCLCVCVCVCVCVACVGCEYLERNARAVCTSPTSLFLLQLMPAPKFSFPVVKVCRASSCDILLSQSKLGNRETWADASRTQVLLQDQADFNYLSHLLFIMKLSKFS